MNDTTRTLRMRLALGSAAAVAAISVGIVGLAQPFAAPSATADQSAAVVVSGQATDGESALTGRRPLPGERGRGETTCDTVAADTVDSDAVLTGWKRPADTETTHGETELTGRRAIPGHRGPGEDTCDDTVTDSGADGEHELTGRRPMP